MTHRLRIDTDIAKAAAQGKPTTIDSQRKAYKNVGHIPFIPSVLADPAYRSIMHAVDGFELFPVDVLHQVCCMLKEQPFAVRVTTYDNFATRL